MNFDKMTVDTAQALVTVTTILFFALIVEISRAAATASTSLGRSIRRGLYLSAFITAGSYLWSLWSALVVLNGSSLIVDARTAWITSTVFVVLNLGNLILYLTSRRDK